MGRRIEHCMLHLASEWARSRDLTTLRLDYKKTAKNLPCHQLLMASELTHDAAETQFTWDCEAPFPRPRGIEVNAVSSSSVSEVGA